MVVVVTSAAAIAVGNWVGLSLYWTQCRPRKLP